MSNVNMPVKLLAAALMLTFVGAVLGLSFIPIFALLGISIVGLLHRQQTQGSALQETPMGTRMKAFLLVGKLPLVIYPFVLLADLMQLAGYRSGHEPRLLLGLTYAFLFGSLAYPVVYLLSAATARAVNESQNQRGATVVSSVPVIYLLLLAILFWTLLRISR